MGVFFEKNSDDYCCLCGSAEASTGEHKIKASAIRAEFGAEKLVIGHFGDTAQSHRDIQGPKSKNLHYRAKVCLACNSSRTQKADREFDNFNALVRQSLVSEKDPTSVFELPRYEVGSSAYLDIFRYFAKLMCCHIGDFLGPRPVRLAKFAVSEIDKNCVFLGIDRDPIQQQFSRLSGEYKYAAHGGLGVFGEKKTGEPTGLFSSLTIGPVKYSYSMRFGWAERLELRLLHPTFHNELKTKVLEAIT